MLSTQTPVHSEKMKKNHYCNVEEYFVKNTISKTQNNFVRYFLKYLVIGIIESSMTSTTSDGGDQIWCNVFENGMGIYSEKTNRDLGRFNFNLEYFC